MHVWVWKKTFITKVFTFLWSSWDCGPPAPSISKRTLLKRATAYCCSYTSLNSFITCLVWASGGHTHTDTRSGYIYIKYKKHGIIMAVLPINVWRWLYQLYFRQASQNIRWVLWVLMGVLQLTCTWRYKLCEKGTNLHHYQLDMKSPRQKNLKWAFDKKNSGSFVALNKEKND